MAQTWQEHIGRQEALVGNRYNGVILLGDISGYTALITRTELEHSQAIMQYIFEMIYQATGERFLVNEIEGDAIFAYCVNPDDPKQLLEETVRQFRSYGDAFESAKQEMLARRSVDMKACPCNACSTIYQLSFKFIIHYGEFAINQVGPFVKLVGGSIILAHRLLKNSVPSKSYILMTEDALQFLSPAEQGAFTRATEEVEHFAQVKIGYQLLTYGAQTPQDKVGQLAATPEEAMAAKAQQAS